MQNNPLCGKIRIRNFSTAVCHKLYGYNRRLTNVQILPFPLIRTIIF